MALQTSPLQSEYSDNWKNINSLLIYRDKQFQFKSSVIITELDNCLFDHITTNKLYDTRNDHVINYNEELVKQLSKDCIDHSLVIFSNQINQSKLNIDTIKKKVEKLVTATKLPIIAFFATVSNCFSKPHTGMWKLLNAYYKKFSGFSIQKVCVLSDNGGLIVEKERKGVTDACVAYRDTDRAFAHNISADYYTIDEYLDQYSNTHDRKSNPNCGRKVKFAWDRNIIPPEVRKLYCDTINAMDNINIFKELSKFKNASAYIIMVMGAPRSGKTRFSRDILKKWRASKFGEHNEVKRLSRDKFSKVLLFNTFRRLIDDRISVIIDGDCNTENERAGFLRHAESKNIPVLFVEVNIGIEMARVLNHACVEDAIDEKVTLYKDRMYYIFRSMYKRPKQDEYTNGNTVTYYPTIDEKTSVMLYRY